MVDLAEERLGHLLVRLLGAHDLAGAAPDLGEPLDQKAVGAGADAEGVEPLALLQGPLDVGQHLAIVANQPVGEQHEAAQPPVGRRRQAQDLADAVHQLGAAVGVEGLHVGECFLAVGLGVGERLAREPGRRAREVDDVEGVFRVEPLDEAGHQHLGLLDGVAHLRARGVDQKDDVARHDLVGVVLHRRRQVQGEVAATGVFLRQHAGAGAIARGPVAQDQILVGQGVRRLKAHAHRPRLRLGQDAVRVRAHVRDGRGRLDAHVDRDVLARAHARLQRRRRDAAGIRHAAVLRDVARPDDHREDELVVAALELERGGVADRHVNLFARLDVRDGLGEDVVALLLEQGRRLALVLGVLVNLLGFLALLDVGLDHALADANLHRIDGRLFRQWEHVDRLERALEGVLEGLLHLHARHVARDARVDLGVLESQGQALVVFRRVHAAGGHVGAAGDRLVLGDGHRGRRRDGQRRLGGRQQRQGHGQAEQGNSVHGDSSRDKIGSW
ncbi:hypothetical protein D3C72_737600 [compost metagenome]